MATDATAAAQRFYGRWADLYDVLARSTPGLGRLRARVADALALDPGDTVVEMGCGTGANFPHLRERVGPEGRVVGVDFTQGMLVRARDRIDREGWRNVHCVRGDATSVAFREPPDAVLATFVVGMLGDPAAEVNRWADTVAPGGRLALLDAAQTTRWFGWPVNRAFRGLVVASSPSGVDAYEAPPWTVLDGRVAAARRALRERAAATTHEEHALGVVRLTAGRIE
ncbi:MULTISPECIES: class I SAM-dependent methyltransferase [Halorussus]|uniref:class I SAM-dependent methyltransferase n=1 Tax=Halorussus TaxID=1070314 RepID=UPI000E21647A|nr:MULTISPECIES: methyltransferase domain-containing protein [Halorussus]NHN57728.1 methyltransferase domain-containing protein [Halorussus sp. JP-T4]